MKDIIIRKLENGILVGEYEPGNGTNYKAIAVEFPSEDNFNYLGAIRSPGWLVVNCNNGKSWLFQKQGYLADRYVQEKLGSKGKKFKEFLEREKDYLYLGSLVRRLIGRWK